MWVEVLKSKIHRATITSLELHYSGSITIDKLLLKAANLLPNEKVTVVNINNGARFETYIIEGEAGSGMVQLNGATARLALPGDVVIVMCYAIMTPEEAVQHQPVLVFPDAQNSLEA